MKIKKIIGSLTICALAGVLFAGCTTSSQNKSSSTTTSSSTKKKKAPKKIDINSLKLPQLETTVAQNEDVVELVTSKGTIKIKLFPEYAPKAVENFMKHAKDGYYNGTTFHRVINEFMIQGGDPNGNGTGGASIWNKEFAPEISNNLYHIRGALAMARTSGSVTEKTQGSQFYIVQNNENVSDGLLSDDYPQKIIEAYKKGGTPTLDKQYSVFGQVIEGMDVVDTIAHTSVDSSDKPTETITVEKINILQEAK